jgi:hypothetical protein
MNTKNIEKGLTKGLISGYGGKTKFTTVIRGSIELKSSHFEEQNLIYHDEWLPNNIGGGQELLKIGDQQFTRLYSGGTIKEEKLKSLGITKKDVILFLKETILEQKEKTRLFKKCNPKPKNGWSYSYQILEKETAISLVVSKETISFKNEIVFVHCFFLCPII